MTKLMPWACDSAWTYSEYIPTTTRLKITWYSLDDTWWIVAGYMMMIPYLVSLYAISTINQNIPMIPNATAVDGSLLNRDAIIAYPPQV